MGEFQTVTIETRAGHYELSQGGEVLFRIPRAVFERYDAGAVFPPSWAPATREHPVRRLYWNPRSLELLMAGLEAHPARTAELHGTASFRSFLQGFWIPSPPVLLLRPFWNPDDPREPFGRRARERSFQVQMRLVGTLERLRPPSSWVVILNATEPYLEALGVNPDGLPPEPGAVRELSLTPPAPLEDEAAREALRTFAVEHPGTLFPVIRPERLVGVHALSLPAEHTAEAVLRKLGLLYQEGPFRPH